MLNRAAEGRQTLLLTEPLYQSPAGQTKENGVQEMSFSGKDAD